MSEKILEALRKLSPDNEEHWTTEGLPRLDVLKELTGEVVSRVDVTNAARGFSRTTTSILDAASNTPLQKTTTEPNSGADGAANMGVSEQLESSVNAEDADYLEHLQDKKAALELAVNDAAKKASDANAELYGLQKQLMVTDNELSKVLGLNQPQIFSDTIKAYQASQQKQRLQAADNAALLSKAMELVAQGKVV